MEKNNLIAFLFPGQGQGSVKVGMGKEIYEKFPQAREIFFRADDYLKRKFSHLCFFGPEEELLKTKNSQLASLILNLAYFTVKNEVENEIKELEIFKRKTPHYLAGHSVGLISALVVSEVVNFQEALEIVKERGALMEKACQMNPGKMIAVINYKKEAIDNLIREYNLGGNFNSPNQIVLSGSLKEIEKITQIINKEKFGKIVPLKTEGAFHSIWMKAAEAPFTDFLENISFSHPKIPILANSKAEILIKAEDLKKELVAHISRPVMWQKGIELMISLGVKNFLEIGYGDVLTKFIQKSFSKNEIMAVSLSSLIKN